MTALRVAVPKMPSEGVEKPRASRNPWAARTSEPRLPRLWVG